MPNILVESKLIIELSTEEEIQSFASLVSEVKNAYMPPQTVGFQIKPKFEVPENIGELCLSLYPQIFGEELSFNEDLGENIENYVTED